MLANVPAAGCSAAASVTNENPVTNSQFHVGGALNDGAYILSERIHNGPRSSVWRATEVAAGRQVVIKVNLHNLGYLCI